MCGTADATTYYVSNSGSDTNSGTSIATRWRTIAKVNSTNFVAGDSILFAGREQFEGSLRLSSLRGTTNSPIIISSYGLDRATIVATNGPGFFAYNCSGCVVSNVNFIGGGSIVSTNDGVSFYTDLVTNSFLSGNAVYQVEASGFGGRGISFGAWNGNTFYRDVTIVGCSVHDNLEGGIVTYAPIPNAHSNIYVGYCQAYNNFGDPAATMHTGSGIVLGQVSGGVVEYCAAHDNGKHNGASGEGPYGIWCHNSQFITLQCNEAHHNHTSSAYDGGGLDLDVNTKSSTMQYNYSHDNDGAGYLVCCDGNTSGSIVRYNISQNDARKNGVGAIYTYGTVTNTFIHNNTVFVTNVSPTPSALLLATDTVNTRVHNNIFQTSGGAVLMSIANGQTGIAMQGNDYWSGDGTFSVIDGGVTYLSLVTWRTATAREKLNGTNTGFNLDPKLVSPGGGGTFNDATLLTTLVGYQLQTNSPMMDVGLNLPKLGLSVGTRDFFGVSSAQGIGFDIGASETKNPASLKGTWLNPGFRIDALGTLNKTNTLESSTNAIAWFALTNTTSVVFQFTDTNASTNPRRFYRLRQ